MIVFWQTRSDLQSYFARLQQFLSEPSKVIKAKHVFWPSISALFNVQREVFDEAVQYKIVEKCYKLKRSLRFYERASYYFLARWLYASDVRKLQKEQPQLLVIWNGLKFRQSLTVLAAKHLNIETVFFENGLLPNTTVVDFKGVNAGNSLPQEAQFYKDYLPKQKFIFEDLEVRAPVSSKNQGVASLPEKFIFIPFQVDSDSQIIKYSPFFKNMESLFFSLSKLQPELGEVALVFKEHPSSHVDYRYLHQYQVPEKVVFANAFNTQELIEKSLAVVTINSTVGIEALTLGKPLLVLGKACYAISGLCLTADQTDLEDKLLLLTNFQFEEHLREHFLSYLQYEYLLEGSWKTASDEHCQLVASKLQGGG